MKDQKLTAEQLLATHEERVKAARTQDRWRDLSDEQSSAMAEAYSGPFFDDSPLPTALERMRLVLRG